MKKSLGVAALITSILIFTQVVFAQDSTSSPTVKKIAPIQRIETKTQNITNKIASREADITQKRMMLDEQEANFKMKLEDMRAKIASQEAKFKERLQQFKDKKKVEIAQRVNTNLNKINQNQTSQMLKNLDTFSSILDKLNERINLNSPDIKNPTEAKVASDAARSAIDSAKSVVQAQAQNDYTITITSETKINQDARTKRNQLYKDLMAVRKQVIDARKEVSDAIRIAKGGPKEATPSVTQKEGTNSGQQ